MKNILIILTAVLFVSFATAPAMAKDVPLLGKDAQLHRIVSADPGAVQVPTNYSKAIKIKQLGKNDVAYWNPDGGKYITTAADYAFVWCRILNTKSGSSHYHWVAISETAMDQALELMHKFPSGVAFYKITSEGGRLAMVAYPYDTLHAISQGQPVVDVKE
jgi:hypothetical protein